MRIALRLELFAISMISTVAKTAQPVPTAMNKADVSHLVVVAVGWSGGSVIVGEIFRLSSGTTAGQD